MSVKHIDYVGFTFNGVHSSSLGIVRTSEGSRFNENLLPTIQDKTVQVPGGDGMYHFGSYYTQKQFNISYAFDSLTEEQLARIKEVFGDKKVHELIFDEAPYKAYYAKVTGTASIKHIPFSEGVTDRVYKGEGTIQFTAYDPYAYSVNKYLDQYLYKVVFPNQQINIAEGHDVKLEYQEEIDIEKKYRIIFNGRECTDILIDNETETYIRGTIPSADPNLRWVLDKNNTTLYVSSANGDSMSFTLQVEENIASASNYIEWKDAANLLDKQANYDKIDGNRIKLYNPGVKETDFILSLQFKNRVIPAGQIYISVDGETKGQLTLKAITPMKEDEEIRINTKLNLIEGYKNGQKTGNIYNKYISAGTFFKIPVSKNMIMYLPQSDYFNNIEYRYIYF